MESRTERFERILREQGGRVARIAAAWARSRAETDDLTQEIALALWEALPRFRGDCSERTFVLRIAQNQALTHHARRRLLVEDLPEEGPATEAPGPDARAEAAQRHQQLLCAVRRLPPRFREVVSLGLEGLSVPEIAEVVGITENNAAVRLSRARELLRSALGEKGARP